MNASSQTRTTMRQCVNNMSEREAERKPNDELNSKICKRKPVDLCLLGGIADMHAQRTKWTVQRMYRGEKKTWNKYEIIRIDEFTFNKYRTPEWINE